MRRQSWLWPKMPALVASLLLAALAVLLPCLHLYAAEEPVYDGKPASYWIKRLADSFQPNEIFGRPSVEEPMRALRSMGSAAVPAAIEALQDENGFVRTAAAYALGEFCTGAQDAVPALVETLRSGRLGGTAIEALEKIGSPARAAIPQLSQGLKHKNLAIRVNMACALAALDPQDKAAVDCLVDALHDQD